VAAHLIGVAMARYVLGVAPIDSASVDDIFARVTPALDHYLEP